MQIFGFLFRMFSFFLLIFALSSSSYGLPYRLCNQELDLGLERLGISVPENYCSSYTVLLGKNETLAGLMYAHSLLPEQVFSPILNEIGKHVNLRRMAVGTPLKVTSSEQGIKVISLSLTTLDSLLIESLGPGWSVSELHHQVSYRKVAFTGLVESSLWGSAEKAGMDPTLIAELSEIFAWQLDFSRELRANDRWRIIVNRILVDGRSVGFGPILAAEFENRGEMYSAVRYEYTPGHFDYFSPNGQSLKRMFLKSPLKFTRISSRFVLKRFHPVLKTYRPHNGVDYAAPPGTPVMSVGGGRVEVAGRRGGSGIMVKVKHNSIYKTAYLHLRAIAKGVKPGAHIEQGQVIGYVGSTGWATGPHLHFSFYEGGKYVDPLGKKFPSKDPIPRDLFANFSKVSDDRLAALPKWPFDQIDKEPKG